jgi:Leucine-rich repeat (LRR) protein
MIMIQYNALTRVPSRLFNGLVKLRLLYLDSNHLTSLALSSFSGLNSLERLVLDNNSFASFPPPDLFTSLTQSRSDDLH